MPFITPTARVAAAKESAAAMNQDVINNIIYLQNTEGGAYRQDAVSDLTTSSSSWVNVDGTNWSYTFTLGVAADVLVGLVASVDLPTAGNTVNFDFTLDGTRVGLDDGILIVGASSSSVNTRMPATFTWLLRAVAAGSHTITLQWKSPAGTAIVLWAGAGTASKDMHPAFWYKVV